MGFLDNFITVKKDEETPQPVVNKTPTPSVQQTVSPIQQPQPTILLGGGVVDQKFVEHFNKVLEEANLPGPDYFEFIKAYDDTQEFATSMTEATRMQMVFKTMKSTGLTKEIILSSAEKYKSILADDKTKYEGTVTKKREVEVGNRQASIEQITADNEDKNKQIAALQAEIQKNNDQIAQTKTEINQIGAQLDQNQTNFNVTYNAFVGKLDGDIIKITNNL